jgi:nucleoid-associated protein YgaU
MLRTSCVALVVAGVIMFGGCGDPNTETAAAQHDKNAANDRAYAPPPSYADSAGGSGAGRSSASDNYAYADSGTGATYDEVLSPEKSGAGQGGRTYVVKKGDTLMSIARKFYNGDASRWKQIREANRAAVSDPNHLHVGTRLVIP